MSHDDWNDEYDDDHDFDGDDFDGDDFDDDSIETLPCPNCGAEVYEEAKQCPICGSYIIFNTSIWSGRPIWWIILAVLGCAAIIWVLVMGF